MKKLLVLLILFYSVVIADTIYFKKGWNFVGFNNTIDFSKDKDFSDNSKVKIIWKYTADNSSDFGWNIYTKNDTIKQKALELGFYYNTILSYYEGAWVYALKDFSYTPEAKTHNKTNTDIPFYHGWNLVSSVDNSKAFDMNNKNIINSKAVWVYKNNTWYGKLANNPKLIYKKLTSIEPYQAFWLYYEPVIIPKDGKDGKNGTDGKDGADGKSAYQIWLDAGNSGSEQDFLDSLKGKDGKDGVNGTNGVDGKDYKPPVDKDITFASARLIGTVNIQNGLGKKILKRRKLYGFIGDPNRSLKLAPKGVSSMDKKPYNGKIRTKDYELLTNTFDINVSSDGSFTVDNLPSSGEYSLIYVDKKNNIGTKIDDISIKPGEEKVIDIGSAFTLGSIKLNIQSLLSNTNLENAKIILGELDREILTDKNGDAFIDAIPQGSYSLRIQKDGYVSKYLTFNVTANQTINLETIFLNSQKGSLRGKVTSTTLPSLDNIVVYAKASDGSLYSTLTNISGIYKFEALPVDKGYSVIAYAYGYASSKVDNIDISNNTTSVALDISISKLSSINNGSISGFARFGDKDGLNHAGIIVSLEGTDYEAITARDGSFILNNIPQGRYTINFIDSNYDTTTIKSKKVVAGATTILRDITLSRVKGVVKGTVNLQNFQDNTGIKVSIKNTNYFTYTDSTGKWSMQLPVGNYDGVIYEKDLYETIIDNNTITITKNGNYTTSSKSIIKIAQNFIGKITVSGTTNYKNCYINIYGISGDAKGVTANINPNKDGTFNILNLPLGEYSYTITYSDGLHESIVGSVNLDGSSDNLDLKTINLRSSYLQINNDDIYTNSKTVTLLIGSNTASYMQISEGSTIYDKEPFASSKTITLSGNNGVKNIKVDLFDKNNNPLPAVLDTIILDNVLQLSSFTLDGASTKGDTLHIKLNIGETNAKAYASIVGLFENIKLVDNGKFGDEEANDGIYERTYTISTSYEIEANATANVTDKAGNKAIFTTSSPLVLKSQPSIKNINTISDAANNQMTINFTTDEPTTSLISYGDSFTSLDNEIVIKDTLSTNHTITLSNLAANTDIYYEIKVKDASNLQSLYKSKDRLAPKNPTNISIIAGNSEVGLIWDKVAKNAVGYNIYRSLDNASFSKINQVLITQNYYLDEFVSNAQIYYYYITAVDKLGNESLASEIKNATPKDTISGPTSLSNALIDSNQIWLKSKSPYNIDKDIKIKERIELILMPGTQVKFKDNYKLLVEGKITGYGTKENMIVFEKGEIDFNTNEDSILNYAQFNYMKADGYSHLILKNSIINNNGNNLDIYLLENSIFNEFGSGSSSYDSNNRISKVINSNFSFMAFDSGGNPTTSSNYIAYINSAINSTFSNASFKIDSIIDSNLTNTPRIKTYSISKANIINASISEASHIENSTLTNITYGSNNECCSYDSSNATFKNNTITKSTITLSGDNKKLTMHYNIFDKNTTLSADKLDISYNYWGENNLTSIAKRTGYSSDKDKKTHLYPIITSSSLYTADFDDDGIPDYMDSDNDNDGYSDLQEDWASDPKWGSVFSPIDANSYPVDSNGKSLPKDNDMDGIADEDDADDDNDGLSDEDEINYGTNPFLKDSDGDGVDDNDEIIYKYDPLDKDNYPLVGDKSGINIDSSNVNSDGVVYIAGNYLTLTNITIKPGTKITIQKDTRVTIRDSIISGTKESPIIVRSSGAGDGKLYIDNSDLSYANIKIAFRMNLQNSKISFSDIEFNNDWDTFTSSNSIVTNSFIAENGYLHNNGTIKNSYIFNNNYDFYNNAKYFYNIYAKKIYFNDEILPYKVSSIWDPTNVGCWWDKDDPDTFPEKNPLTNSAILKGKVNLPNTTDNSGVVVSIPNTSISTTTDTDGNWNLTLKARTYEDIEYSKEYFQTKIKNIYTTLESGETKTLEPIDMTQKYGVFKGSVTIDEASDFTLATITATKNGVTTTFHPQVDGSFISPQLTLGDYTITISYPNGSWESVSYDRSIVSGVTEYTLPKTHLRNSFVYINNNATYTNTQEVNLSLTNANASTMQISYGDTTLDEEDYSQTKTITLSSGDGVKNVNVVFKDSSGTTLTPASSSIILDTTVSLNSLTHSGASTMQDTLSIVLDAGESGGEATVSVDGLFSDLKLNDNGDGTYSTEYIIDTADEFDTPIEAHFIDRAGNIADISSSSNLVLATTPTISNIHSTSSNTDITITFDTNEPTTAILKYGTNKDDLNDTKTISATEKTSHSIDIAFNTSETLYYEITVDDSSTSTVTQSESAVLSSLAPSSINGSAGDKEVGLIWSKIDNATGYNIYRSTNSNHFTKINTTPTTNIYYLDTTVSNDTTYYYRVTAIVDGKESDKTLSLKATPSSSYAGPTTIDGGVILADTIWLSSRSPYKLTGNILIKENRKLILLAGAKIEMLGDNRHIMNKGYIYGYGSSDSKIVVDDGSIIFDTTNKSELNFAEINNVKIYKKDSSGTLVSLTLNNSAIKVNNNSGKANFYVNKINNSIFKQEGYGENYYYNITSSSYARIARFGTSINSIFKKVNSSGENDTTNNYIVYITNSDTNSTFIGGGIYGSTFNDSTFTNVYKVSGYTHNNIIADGTIFENVSSIKNSRIDNGSINGSNMKLNNNKFNNTNIKISNTTKLTMRYNILDSSSKIVNSGNLNKYFDISYNYWGSSDLDTIVAQTNYSPSKDDNTHLYPIITSPLLYEADFDGDGIEDYRDNDNDNDGFSDLQEDWDSDPAYGSIYSPLDSNSYPGSDTGATIDKDNDMDGTANKDDLDDDNDGISDKDEETYGTNPLLKDSDGDGVDDNDEIAYKYDPLDKDNYPIKGNQSGINIDSSNVNSDGVVYIASSTTLTNITITAGTKITIKDASVTFKNSTIYGSKENPIIFRYTGTGKIYLKNTSMNYANIQLYRIYLQTHSNLSNSDIELYNYANIDSTSILENSFIKHPNSDYWYNYGTVKNTYITGSYYIKNYGTITSSYSNLNSYYIRNYGTVRDSYANYVCSYNSSNEMINSITDKIYANSTNKANVVNSDIKLSSSGTRNIFFNNTFIGKYGSDEYYSGLGDTNTTDQIGDRVTETTFSIDGSDYKVDGIVNPRDTKNYPDWVNDPSTKQYFWDPTNVGCLWDKDNPDEFPEP